MIRARIVLPSLLLILSCILFSTLTTVHAADFCFSESQVSGFGAETLSTMTKTTVNGQTMYCSTNPPNSGPGTNPATAQAPAPLTNPDPSAEACPPGAHHATAAEAIQMQQAGIPGAQAGWCWDPTDKDVGQSDAEAKQYLLSLAKGLPNTQAPPDADHINKLNSTFAVCEAAFFKSYISKYGPVTISSAFRCGPNSPANIQCNRQENANAKGAPGSNHQLGLAIDVNPAGGNSSYQTMWDYAKANPQFGVCFPYLDGDKPHMTLAGSNTGEAAKCAAQGVTKPCNGLPFTPVAPPPTSNTPSSMISNMLRGLISPAAAQPSPILQPLFTPPPPIQTSQGQTSGQTYYDSKGQPYTFNSSGQAVSSVTGQILDPNQYQNQTQTSVNGTTNSNGQINSGLPTLSNNNPSGGSGAGQAQINPADFNSTSSQSINSHGTSDIDYINSLANSLSPNGGTTGTKTGTSSPAQLNNNLNNVGSQNPQNGGVRNPDGSYQYPIVLPPEATQTFGSPNTIGDLTYSADPSSTFQKVLARLKSALITFSKVLTPFGARAQSLQIVD